MTERKITCLAPTYGRKPVLIKNTIACFLTQEHQEKDLYILDDLGNLGNYSIPELGIYVISQKERFESLPAKYNHLVDLAESDHFAIWDDDDLYLPNHLSVIAEGFEAGYQAVHPERVRSTYNMPIGKTCIEASRKMFHGSLAFSREAFERIGGYPKTSAPDFDQTVIRKLYKQKMYVHPEISYVFRWKDTDSSHAQHAIGKDYDRWYEFVRKDYGLKFLATDIKPEFDDSARKVYEGLKIEL